MILKRCRHPAVRLKESKMMDEFIKPAEQHFLEEQFRLHYEQTKDPDYSRPHPPEYFEPFFQSLAEKFPEGRSLPKCTGCLLESDLISDGWDVSIRMLSLFFPPILHENHFFTVFYVLHGEFTICLEDREICLTEGNVCIISPHVMHAARLVTDAEVVGIAVRNSTFEKTFPNILKDSHSLLAYYFSRALYKKDPYEFLLCKCPGDPELIGYLHEAYRENFSEDPYRSHLQNNLIDRFFVTLLRKYEQDIVFLDELSPRDSEKLILMAKYIQEHSTNLTLKELADLFNYSERQVQRILKSSTGSSFSEIITNAKMNRAADMLSETDQPVSMIAADLGYKNLGHFRKLFRRVFGKSPSEYRLWCQRKNDQPLTFGSHPATASSIMPRWLS